MHRFLAKFRIQLLKLTLKRKRKNSIVTFSNP
jgi:hypothetical protein